MSKMRFLRYRIMGKEKDSDVLNVSVSIGKLGFFYGRWKDRDSWKKNHYNHDTWHFCNVDKEKQVYQFWYRLCIKSRFFEVHLLK